MSFTNVDLLRVVSRFHNVKRDDMANPPNDRQGNYTVTLIEGDGIGPEISQSVKDIFAAAKVGHVSHHTALFTQFLLDTYRMGIGRRYTSIERRENCNPRQGYRQCQEELRGLEGTLGRKEGCAGPRF